MDSFDNAVCYAAERLGVNFTLKVKQREAMLHIYSGEDAFVWLPTGYGKSICYEILPFLFDWKKAESENRAVTACSLVLVVSPLISLMRDQITKLRERGVLAAVLSLDAEKFAESLVVENEISTCSLLYTSPEAILGDRWRTIFSNTSFSSRLVAVAIDEAHCVSKWYV